MKQFKTKPLNNAGFAHFILPVLVVVAIGGIGTYLYTTSHADSLVSCVIAGMPRKSSTVPTQAYVKITNSGSTAITPTMQIATGFSDGLGHGNGGESTQTFGKVQPNATRKFAVNTGSPSSTWSANVVTMNLTATSADPSFSCTATTQKTTSAVVNYLTSLITKLQNGTMQARVTNNPVTVPGPVGEAQARPIVFTLSGVKYFAYTQGQAPDFSGTALGLANSMAVVSSTDDSAKTGPAYLSKANTLVDSNSQAVGFSTGGN